MSITADSIQFFVQMGILSVYIRKQRNRFRSPTPLEKLSDPLVDWDQVRYTHVPRRGYTVAVFLPVDAFGVLVIGEPKT